MGGCLQRGGCESMRGRAAAEVCPLADGQLGPMSVTEHGDLCPHLLGALSLFTLLLKETAEAPPASRR